MMRNPGEFRVRSVRAGRHVLPLEPLEPRALLSTVFSDVPLPYRDGGETILATGDLNADGVVDAVVRRRVGQEPARFGIRFGRDPASSGTDFGSYVPLPVRTRRYSEHDYAFVGRFTPGDDLDIVLIHGAGDREVLVNQGRGDFQLTHSTRGGSGDLESGAVVYLNGPTGRATIASGNQRLRIDQNGISRQSTIASLPSGVIVYGDLDGDGRSDAVVVQSLQPDGPSLATSYFGLGHGQFAELIGAVQMPDSWTSGTLALTDVNTDGRLDLVAATIRGGSGDDGPGALWALMGTVVGEFSRPSFATPTRIGSFAPTGWGDPVWVDIRAVVPTGQRAAPAFLILPWVERIERFVPVTDMGDSLLLRPRDGVGSDLTTWYQSQSFFASREFAPPVVIDIGNDGLGDIIDNGLLTRQVQDAPGTRPEVAGLQIGGAVAKNPRSPQRLTREVSLRISPRGEFGTSASLVDAYVDYDDDGQINPIIDRLWQTVQLPRHGSGRTFTFNFVYNEPAGTSWNGRRLMFRILDSHGLYSAPVSLVLSD